MVSNPARRSPPRAALFPRSEFVQGIKKAVAENDLVAALFSRLLSQVEQDLQVPLVGETKADGEGQTAREHRYQWYAELQEAHRLGSVISRLAICAAVVGRSELEERCAAFMRQVATLSTAWNSPMQDLVIAALARSLCFGYDVLHDSEALGNRSDPAGTASVIENRLSEMGDWLEHYLVKGGNGARRNHDVIVACTLGLIALIRRRDRISEEWLSLAIERLDQLLFRDNQYLGPDGDWYEGSPRYQFYILHWFHLFADACRNLGVRDYYRITTSKRLFTALNHFIAPNGHNLGFNDTSHDEAMMLGLWPLLKGAVEYQDALLFSNLQRIVVRFPEPPLIPAEAMLAFARGSIPTGPSCTGQTTMHFKRTGTVVTRTDWSERASLFAIDCGPHASHHHLAKGTFEFYYSGEPVILDTGCGHYLDRSLWILPEMHNIVVVNGGYKPRYSHPLYGNQAWDFVPECHGRILDVRESEALTFVQVDYSAFARTAGAIRNSWFVSPGYLLIEDRINGQAERDNQYNAFLHIHGQLQAAEEYKGAVAKTTRGFRIQIEIFEPAASTLSLGKHRFATESVAVIKSGGIVRAPAPSLDALDYLQILAQGETAWFLATIIPQESPDGRTCIGRRIKRKLDDGHLLQVEISETVTDFWLFRDEASPYTVDDLETDGRVTWVRVREGECVSWFVLDGTQLVYKGVRLIDSPIQTTYLRQ